MGKRIAILDLLFHYPPTGGSWVDVYEIANRLQKRGHTVCLFVPDFTQYFPRSVIHEKMPFEVRTIQFSRFSFNRFTVPSRFLRMFEEFKPDYIFLTDGYYMKPHLVNAFAEYYKVILRFYAYEVICGLNNHWFTQTHEICTNHLFKDFSKCRTCISREFRVSSNIWNLFSGKEYLNSKMHFTQEYLSTLAFLPSYREVVIKALSKTHQVIVYNDIMAEILKPYTSKIQVTPTGIDIVKYQPTCNVNTIKRILMAGRVDDPVKGVYVLMEACRELWKTRQDFELVITSKDSTKLGDPFMLINGWLNLNQLPRLINTADIFVIPSFWEEAFGITALEAMACGKPVIASAIGGLKRTLKDGETGFLVPPNDPKALLDKLTILLDNKDIRERFGKAGRELVEKEYDWDIIIDKYYTHLFE